MSKCEVVIKETEKQKEYKRVCVGVARSLVVDTDVEVEINKPIADGWYNKFYVENNCIVDVGNEEPITIAAPPCSPTPAPCTSGCGSGSGGDVSISSYRGNLLSIRNDGLFASVHCVAGAGVSIAGNGTEANPIVISMSSDNSSQVTLVAPALGGIDLTQVGNSYSLSLAPTGIVSGSYGRFNVNSFGQIVGYDETSTDDEPLTYTAGEGIDIVEQAPIATIGLEQILPASINFNVPGYQMSLDLTGRVVAYTPAPKLEGVEGTHPIAGIESISINDVGTVVAVTKKEVLSDEFDVPRTTTRAFGGNREEDLVDMELRIPGSITVDIYSSEIVGTPPYPSMSMSDVTVLINNISVPVYIVRAGHAIATAPTRYGGGGIEILVRYKDVISTPSIVRVTQEG